MAKCFGECSRCSKFLSENKILPDEQWDKSIVSFEAHSKGGYNISLINLFVSLKGLEHSISFLKIKSDAGNCPLTHKFHLLRVLY